MNDKHLALRIDQAHLIARASPCPRGQVGCVLIEPQSKTIVSDGYNGGPRGAGPLCAGEHCIRNIKEIESGENCEIGCHHAEANALVNASRRGQATEGAWALITRDPCLMCAKLLHHAGIARVYAPLGISAGCEYLRAHNIPVFVT